MHGSCLSRVTRSWEAVGVCDDMQATRITSSARVVYDDCVLVHPPAHKATAKAVLIGRLPRLLNKFLPAKLPHHTCLPEQIQGSSPCDWLMGKPPASPLSTALAICAVVINNVSDLHYTLLKSAPALTRHIRLMSTELTWASSAVTKGDFLESWIKVTRVCQQQRRLCQAVLGPEQWIDRPLCEPLQLKKQSATR